MYIDHDTIRRRDAYQAHYTTSPHILSFMLKRLKLTPGQHVLEPCAGEGHFIDAILAEEANVEIEAYEINDKSAEKLQKKYAHLPNVRIIHADSLVALQPSLFSKSILFDRIIANPPYGAWQDYSRRRSLKNLFPGLYVKETYGLFLYHCINLLSKNGRLVFIVPDTYLNLHLHKKLRIHLLRETIVEEIIIFPSRFFTGISFGYANLSIITLRKKHFEDLNQKNKIRIIRNLKSSEILSEISNDRNSNQNYEIDELLQEEVLYTPGHAFILPEKSGVHNHVVAAKLTIGNIADVVTGFYSGDDRKWLRPAHANVRGAKHYRVIDESLIFSELSAWPHGEKLSGLDGSKCFIPIVKGGSIPYVKSTEWYVEWSKKAIAEYTKPAPNKARFQNSKYYFREGIGLPMVSSRRVTAALLENRLFDQSIVGIFPHDSDLLYYILGFLNSHVCTRLLRIINPSANNSANYVKKLPFVLPSFQIVSDVSKLVKEIIQECKTSSFSLTKQEVVDSIFENLYKAT
jgi:tRNA1(Val) A37 N6-methylase TrmN6